MIARLVGAGFGYCDVMDMPWTLARDFADAVARIERDKLMAAAVAARAAQADENGWKKWVSAIGAE